MEQEAAPAKASVRRGEELQLQPPSQCRRQRSPAKPRKLTQPHTRDGGQSNLKLTMRVDRQAGGARERSERRDATHLASPPLLLASLLVSPTAAATLTCASSQRTPSQLAAQQTTSGQRPASGRGEAEEAREGRDCGCTAAELELTRPLLLLLLLVSACAMLVLSAVSLLGFHSPVFL